MLHRSTLYGVLVVSAIVASQGRAKLSDHPASTHTLARRSLTSWSNDFKRDFRDSKYRYSRYLKDQGLMYNDRSWRQKRLSYTDERFDEKTRTRTTENYNEDYKTPGVKTFDFLANLAPRPKVANIENVVPEQPKPKPNPDPQLVGAPSHTRPQQQQQQQSTAISNKNSPDNGQETVHPQVQAQAPESFLSAPNESGSSMPNNGHVDEHSVWQWNDNRLPNWGYNQPAPAPQYHSSYANEITQQSEIQPPPSGYPEQFPGWFNSQTTNHLSAAVNTHQNAVNNFPNTQMTGNNYQHTAVLDNQDPGKPIPLSQKTTYNYPIDAGQNQPKNHLAQNEKWRISQRTTTPPLPPTGQQAPGPGQDSFNDVDDLDIQGEFRTPIAGKIGLYYNGQAFAFYPEQSAGNSNGANSTPFHMENTVSEVQQGLLRRPVQG
ncbi:hypothetical protein H4R33_002671 [Dimargaris cristalligena]|uniref:Uncharacterized protein n=1 Tax=Dimargaris cristalligena TaxID=215637 RepID=A0A4P9ZUW6_9FUNG|nr:hypothetical protein H4R33_002671 [Dimargaris cristalligena]RKP37058.1 hypothetical protein BJ085DRAFT_40315 [Dimargaris cristalligena]|eukprot:RKP37058.1 hypothetical protein BJ085DRAFT_40315 [Dimargaris cristalligena]